MTTARRAAAASPDLIDSRYAMTRLGITLLLMMVGASGMYVVPVVLPAVQAEFGVARADASLPYTLLMIGFGVGGMVMGRLADRFGVTVPLIVGAAGLSLGYVAAALAGNIVVFAVAHGLLIGLAGLFGHFCTAAGGHLAVVPAPPRHCGGGVRQRQLPGRRGLAAHRAALRRNRGLAADLPGPGRVLWCGHDAACAADAAAAAPGRRLAGGERPCGFVGPAVRLAGGAGAGAAVRGRCGLLRGHVDAAGPHRGLLRRPGFRRRARCRDAVAHARMRHREPADLGPDLRPHWRSAHAAAGVVPADRGPGPVPAL